MKVTYTDNVPGWIRSAVKRWVRFLRLSEWRIEIERAESEELSADGTVNALCHALPDYLAARIEISDEVRDTEDGHRVIIHELRHLHYSEIDQVVRHCWDERRKLSRDEVFKLLEGTVERLIERDVNILCSLTKK